MAIRGDISAIERGAGEARPGTMLMLNRVLGGLLLLSAP